MTLGLLVVLAAACTDDQTPMPAPESPSSVGAAPSPRLETCLGGADAQTIDKTYRQIDHLWRRELGGDMLTSPISSSGVR
ncbi:MAG: hypothetical protein OXD34_02380 [bacterium]|nr:hypothetical protein [bacterium]